MRFFHSAKQLSKCSFIPLSFLFFAAAQRKSNSEHYRYRIKLQTSGIDSGAERSMLSFMFD
jgi:hypothetical protein